MEQGIMAREYRYTAVFEPAEEGGFVVRFPALLGLITEGDSLEHARAMAAEALHGCLESLAKDGLPAPAEDSQPQHAAHQRDRDRRFLSVWSGCLLSPRESSSPRWKGWASLCTTFGGAITTSSIPMIRVSELLLLSTARP